MPRLLLLLPAALFFLLWKPTMAAPLSTNSKWFVDESGRRVKLACVNWVSHLEVMVAEGLDKRPLDVISKSKASKRFNCVRFTWPLFLATNDSLASLKVRQSFLSLGLNQSIAAIQANDPTLVDISLLQAYEICVHVKILMVLYVGSFSVTLLCTLFIFKGTNHLKIFGWICMSFSVGVFVAPLSIIKRISTLIYDLPKLASSTTMNSLLGHKDHPGISFYALDNQLTPHTFRLYGLLNSHRVHILIDSDSTYNIIQHRVVEFLQLPITYTTPFHVFTGNDAKLKCHSKCLDITLYMQEAQFQIDFFIMPIQGPDIIFGVQWLQTLGDITINFNSLIMTCI